MKTYFRQIREETRHIMKLGIFIFSLIIIFSIYIPFKRRFLKLEKEWKFYEKSLKEAKIVDSLSTRTRLNQPKFSLAQELDRLQNLFPSEETEVINSVSKLCHKLNIDMISLTPSDKTWAQDVQQNPIMVGERRLAKTGLQVLLQTNFVNLEKYLSALLKLPHLITLEKLNITKFDPLNVESDNLKIELEIACFTLPY